MSDKRLPQVPLRVEYPKYGIIYIIEEPDPRLESVESFSVPLRSAPPRGEPSEGDDPIIEV